VLVHAALVLTVPPRSATDERRRQIARLSPAYSGTPASGNRYAEHKAEGKRNSTDVSLFSTFYRKFDSIRPPTK
jgi:hypothetical protein